MAQNPFPRPGSQVALTNRHRNGRLGSPVLLRRHVNAVCQYASLVGPHQQTWTHSMTCTHNHQPASSHSITTHKSRLTCQVTGCTEGDSPDAVPASGHWCWFIGCSRRWPHPSSQSCTVLHGRSGAPRTNQSWTKGTLSTLPPTHASANIKTLQ